MTIEGINRRRDVVIARIYAREVDGM